MERLTNRDENGTAFIVLDENSKEWSVSVDQPSYAHTIECEAVDKLADYEDAEEKGLLVKIECHCKDCVHWSDMVAGATEHVKLCTVGGYMVGENGYCVYAEQKLASMQKGE